MRAAVMRGAMLVADTLPDPEPGPGEVLVRTIACGICGSDLHTLQHGPEAVAGMRDMGVSKVMDLGRDVVMGHEFAAEVLDYGPGTERTFAAGTPVCSVPLLPRAAGIEALGFSNEVPGGYGELMVLSRELLLPIPNGLAPELAALTEPMAVGVHAVGLANLGPHDVPLVIGCGPVGLAVIAALKLRRASPIVAADFSPRAGPWRRPWAPTSSSIPRPRRPTPAGRRRPSRRHRSRPRCRTSSCRPRSPSVRR